MKATKQISSLFRSQIYDPELVAHLTPLFNSVEEGWMVRVAVVRKLGQAQDPRSLPLLTSALNDPEPWMRYTAMLALSHIQDPQCFTLLQSLIGDLDELVRETAGHIVSKWLDLALDGDLFC